MAALSKGALRTITRALLRDNEKQAWHDSILDIIISQSIDSIAANVIDFAPEYFSITNNSAAPAFPLDLSTLTPRFFRMQQVMGNSQEYFPVSPQSVSMDTRANAVASSVITAPSFSYFIRGQMLYAFPYNSTLALSLTYSYLPTQYLTQLDTDSIAWPEGFEMVIAHDAAAQIVDDEFRTAKFTNLRNEKLDALYSKVKRQYSGPAVQNGVDDGLAWSSI